MACSGNASSDAPLLFARAGAAAAAIATGYVSTVAPLLPARARAAAAAASALGNASMDEPLLAAILALVGRAGAKTGAVATGNASIAAPLLLSPAAIGIAVSAASGFAAGVAAGCAAGIAAGALTLPPTMFHAPNVPTKPASCAQQVAEALMVCDFASWHALADCTYATVPLKLIHEHCLVYAL